MKRAPWPEDRRDELQKLIQLIHECQGINCSGRIIQKLQRLETIANELSDSDYCKPRASFALFLIDQATGSP
jgi:hypothetical protein